MKRPLIHAPYKGVHPYFEILRFLDEKPPKDFHFFILTRTRYITGSKINLFFIGLLDSELFKGAAHTLMRQPLLHKEKHCATRVLLVTHFYRKPPLEEGYAGEIAVTGGLIDRFRLADQ